MTKIPEKIKNPHSIEVKEVFQILKSSPAGLSREQVNENLETYGQNIIEAGGGINALQLILRQLKSPLIYLLAGASIISLLTGHYADAVIIAVVIILNTILGFFQEYKAEQALESLRKMTNPKARVLRDNRTEQIDASNLVPGDILILETGDRIAGDARLIQCQDLEVDESILTGESEPILKQTDPVKEDSALGDRINMVWISTTVTGGRGKAVVVATGMESQLGQIAEQVQTAGGEETPLQKRMSRLGMFLGFAGVGFAVLVFLLGLLTGYEFLEMLLFSVAVAVSAIPEGLPAVISVTLALGVQRMARRKAVIRSLPAVETLGSTTVICSDKTGTITKNEMTVKSIFTGGTDYNVSGEGYSIKGDVSTINKEDKENHRGPLNLLSLAGILANNAQILEEKEGISLSGSPTEKAILACSVKAFAGDMKMITGVAKVKRLSEIPFSSSSKYMAVSVGTEDLKVLETGSFFPVTEGELIFVKGAPERIIQFCDKIHFGEGEVELDLKLREEILAKNEALGSQALRVIAAGYKRVSKNHGDLDNKDIEEGLTFLGLWGMIDPPREDAIEAIKEAKQAGIRVVMITGDHAVTASAIAHIVGIAPKGRNAVSGPEIDSSTDEELVKAAFETGVFARVSPTHKLRILKALKEHGEIVAMTGDGVNDAPALKGADIGVAMGITGTEVAKGASDMILLDDNFATLVHAVEEGRGIFENLQRVIFFLLTTNLGEIITLAVGLILGLPLPLTAIMILWINLVTDGACTIPLGVEPREKDLLKYPPRSPGEPVIGMDLLFRLLILSAIMATGTLVLFTQELETTTMEHSRTMAFTALAAFQWFQAFTARSKNKSIFKLGLFSNRWLLIGVGSAMLLQLFAIYTPWGRLIFNTVPLNPVDWLLILGVTSTIWIIDEILKALRVYQGIGTRRRKPL